MQGGRLWGLEQVCLGRGLGAEQVCTECARPVLQESATYGEHIWFETNVSGDFCYVGEQYCVAKMLVSERGAARRPLVVEPGLEPCRQALPGEGGNGALA